MQRRITGFHQDHEQHWVADLECGHTQHVRHDPPFQTRLWVLTEESRRTHLGTPLDCLLCDAPSRASFGGPDALELSPEARAAYEDARLRGLCEDGASEVARNNST